MRSIKVLDIREGMGLECVKTFGDEKPTEYRLYLIYSARGRDGYYTTHRKQLARYSDFESVIFHIKDMYLAGLSGRSVEEKLAWNQQYCGK